LSPLSDGFIINSMYLLVSMSYYIPILLHRSITCILF